MHRLSEAEKNREIGMLQAGLSVLDVSRTLNCSRNTIHELARRFRETDNVSDRPRSGRPRATSQRDDHVIVLRHLRNRFTLQRWQRVILMSLHKQYAIGCRLRIARLEHVTLTQEVLWRYDIASHVYSGHACMVSDVAGIGTPYFLRTNPDSISVSPTADSGFTVVVVTMTWLMPSQGSGTTFLTV